MTSIKLSKRIAGRRNQFGQGMTEYIIIVALIAIGAIAVYSAFGHTVQGQMAEITNGLAGNSGGVTSGKQIVTTEASQANTDATAKLGLDDYGNNVKDQ
jgi:Flp pilus assembly pilin Flp